MRAERGEATRRALCLAAETLVAQHGLEAATLRRVAEAAGQRNIGVVTYHFGTVPRLLRAIVEMRLNEAEAFWRDAIAAFADPDAMDAFHAWLCVVRPALLAPGERSPHAHVRFLLHMRLAGMLSDPFDPSIDRKGTPALDFLLGRIRERMRHLPPHIARARISLCGLMYWNAIVLHSEGQDERPEILGEILADVEQSARSILSL
jgi:AcrR family transcriptional regulator